MNRETGPRGFPIGLNDRREAIRQFCGAIASFVYFGAQKWLLLLRFSHVAGSRILLTMKSSSDNVSVEANRIKFWS